MTARFLVDTNLLVYIYDRSEPAKQKIAETLYDRLTLSGRGVISTQIMAEFFNVTTRRLSQPLPPEAAYRRLENYQRSWEVVNVTPTIVLEAVRGVIDHQLSFWDALIWATAKLNQIAVILSEDFRSGASLEGVRFVNPLSDDFDLELWLGNE
jgi:predicted nucleic acid-binding protein